jgi:glycosyltransferase involved in cell wall biosynthesis
VKRILYTTWAPFFSGAERALLLTVQQLDPARYDPHVVIGTDGDTLRAFRTAGISCELHPLAQMDSHKPWRWVRSAAGLLRIFSRVRPSVVHSNDAPSFQPAGHVARLLGIPSLAHVRFPAGDAGYRWFLRPGFTRALFVSEYLRADALQQSPALFTGRSDVLYDGVAVPLLPSDRECDALRQELGLPLGIPVAALTGQISEVKGIWEFVDAAHLLVERGVPVRFAVLGDDLKSGGALRRAMERRVSELGLSAHFHFLGFRSDAPRLIPAFDMVAVPSHIEPLGNATLEAMAAARPVIGSRVGGIPEMIVDGETGVLVPSKDARALAAAIELLGRSSETRARYGTAARLRASVVFSLFQHGKRLQEIYDGIIDRRS